MTKILQGAMGLAATAAIVGAAGYALFTTTATVSGINFSTGSLLLEVSGDGTNFSSALDANLDINNVFPGFGMDDSQTVPFFVRNSSADGSLDVTAQLTAATGWNDSALKDWVEVAVVEDLTPETSADDTVADEDYMSLMEWNATPQPLVEGLDGGEVATFDVYARMSELAPNSLQGKSLTDIEFTLTGTQVEEVVETE